MRTTIYGVLVCAIGSIANITLPHEAEAARYIDPYPMEFFSDQCPLSESIPCVQDRSAIFDVKEGETITFGEAFYYATGTDSRYGNCSGHTPDCDYVYGGALIRFIFSPVDEFLPDDEYPFAGNTPVSCDATLVHEGEPDQYYEYNCPDYLQEALLAVVPKGAYGAQLVAFQSYEITPPISLIPLPATFPLMAVGLGALSFIGWRRRSEQQ